MAARIDSFLRLVADQKASDLHFMAGAKPVIRHDGELVRLPFRQLSENEADRFLKEILSPEEQTSLERGHELDFVYDLEDVGRFRVNVFRQAAGPGAVFRIIPRHVPSVDELLLPARLKHIINLQAGLVLVCGPTGSGKTTTLAAIVNEINTHQARHVITIEDPIEFIHPPKKSLVTQRQIGMHADSFAGALRSALRESPDVIVVGELRDLDTIGLALSAAETGALVLGTLHTNSAAKAVDRLIDGFSEEARDQVRGVLSVLLKSVINQALLKRATGEGRIAAVEILETNIAIQNFIRENKIHHIESLMHSGEGESGQSLSLDACIFKHVADGLVTMEEALSHARDPMRLRRRIEAIPED